MVCRYEQDYKEYVRKNKRGTCSSFVADWQCDVCVLVNSLMQFLLSSVSVLVYLLVCVCPQCGRQHTESSSSSSSVNALPWTAFLLLFPPLYSPSLLLCHPLSFLPLCCRWLYLYATGFLFVPLYHTVSPSWLSLSLCLHANRSYQLFLSQSPINSPSLSPFHLLLSPTPAPIFILLFSLYCYTSASLPLGLSLSLKQP